MTQISRHKRMDANGIIKQGVIEKWTNFMSSWKSRHLIVEAGLLKYASFKGGPIKETFVLDTDCNIRPCGSNSFQFKMRYNSGVIYLRASCLAERNEWICALTTAISLYNQTKYISSSNQNYTPASKSLSQVDMSPEPTMPMSSLQELSVITRREMSTHIQEIRKLQNELTTVLTMKQLSESNLSELNYQLREKTDDILTLLSKHLNSSDRLVDEEKRQRRRLEKLLLLHARSNYRMKECQVSTNIDGLIEEEFESYCGSSECTNRTTSDFHEFEQSASTDIILEKEIGQSDSSTNIVENTHLDNWMKGFQTKLRSELSRRRNTLTKPRTEFKVSLWDILRSCIGKDLSRISMPIYFNEPTTILQRVAEDYQYSDLLDSCSKLDYSLDRLLFVSVFTLSPFSSSVGRHYKPFNPLLGETYELSDLGFFYIAEQVSHHPPVTAYFVENDYFVAWGNFEFQNRFTGRSVEVSFSGVSHIYLPSNPDKDHYSYGRAKLYVENVIFGKLSLEMSGIVPIVNHTSGEFCLMEFSRRGWWSNDFHAIRAIVFDQHGVGIYRLGGNWSSLVWAEELFLPTGYRIGIQLEDFKGIIDDLSKGKSTNIKNPSKISDKTISDIRKNMQQKRSSKGRPVVAVENNLPQMRNTEEFPSIKLQHMARNANNIIINWESFVSKASTRRVIWKADLRPSYTRLYYDFNYMSFALNEITSEYRPDVMPPTDSRFRMDQRYYEIGEIDKAIEEKERLENEQRERGRRNMKQGVEFKPRWFFEGTDIVTGSNCWLYNGQYGNCKLQRKFSDCIKLFDMNNSVYTSFLS